MGLKFVIALITIIVLCTPAFGQMTAEEWFDKGVALMNQSKYDEATRAFDKAIELNPQYVEAWAGKGWSLYGSSKYTDALKTYNTAIELNPNYADAWVGKGFAFLALGFRYSEPVDALNHAIALDPKYPLTWVGGAACDPGALDRAIRLNPTYAKEIASLPYSLDTIPFQRIVFLKEGRPRTPKAIVAPMRPPVPRKTIAERFVEMIKIKENMTGLTAAEKIAMLKNVTK